MEAEVHVKTYFGGSMGEMVTGIWQAWQGRKKGGVIALWKCQVRGRWAKVFFGMLRQRQVTPSWANNTVRRQVNIWGRGAELVCLHRTDIGRQKESVGWVQ